jgi:hypothetical protein
MSMSHAISVRAESNSPGDWLLAHEALSRLARQRAAADAEEGRWLLRAWRSAAHVHLGFGSFTEYVERLFGYKPRSTQEKLRVAEALEQLPALSRSLESGSLSWSAMRELTRVAVPETQLAWLDVARGKTVRQLEELVATKSPGDDPFTSSAPTPRRHVLRFDVASETFSLFRDAIHELRRRAGAALDDDSALLSMARHVLGGPEEAGRASYQIAISVCEACGSAGQQAGGDLVPVGAEVLAMAHCDAQHLGRVGAPANQKVTQHAGGAANDNVVIRDQPTHPSPHVGAMADAHASEVDDAHPSEVDWTHHASVSAPQHTGVHGQPDIPNNRAHDQVADQARAVIPSLHVGAMAVPAELIHFDKPLANQIPSRATQTIPPALRRAVLHRDHGCCRVPGCQNRSFLDLHHIELRSEGGRHQLENIITLCGAHHRALHRGELLIEGRATEARFRHADGSEYGMLESPGALHTHAKVFSALRGLGFREAEARAAFAELRKQPGQVEASAQELLRAALQLLTAPRARPVG